MLFKLLSHLPGASELIGSLSEFTDTVIQFLGIYDSATVYIGQTGVFAMGRVSKPISYIIRVVLYQNLNTNYMINMTAIFGR